MAGRDYIERFEALTQSPLMESETQNRGEGGPVLRFHNLRGPEWVRLSTSSRADWVTVEMVYRGELIDAHIDPDGLIMLYAYPPDVDSLDRMAASRSVRIEDSGRYRDQAKHKFLRRAGDIISEVERRVRAGSVTA